MTDSEIYLDDTIEEDIPYELDAEFSRFDSCWDFISFLIVVSLVLIALVNITKRD